MPQRRKRAEHGCIQHQKIQLVPAPANRLRQLVDIIIFHQIKRRDRGGAAGRMNPVLHFDKPGFCSRRQNHMRAVFCQPLGECCANAPACTRDERSFSLQIHDFIPAMRVAPRPVALPDPSTVLDSRR